VIDNSGVAEILRNVMREVVREMLAGKMGDPFVCPDGKEVFEAMDNSGNEDGGEGNERKEREVKKKEVRAEEAGVKANGADEAGDAKEAGEAEDEEDAGEDEKKAKGAGGAEESEEAEAFGKVDRVCRSLAELDCFMPGKVAGILGECFGVSVDAGYFFLAAWSVWAGRRFKGRVTSEEVLGVLERHGVFVDDRRCGGELLWAGVFEERVGFDVCFSPVGIRLGKKVEGFWRG
jgi:hypothetical protein